MPKSKIFYNIWDAQKAIKKGEIQIAICPLSQSDSCHILADLQETLNAIRTLIPESQEVSAWDIFPRLLVNQTPYELMHALLEHVVFPQVTVKIYHQDFILTPCQIVGLNLTGQIEINDGYGQILIKKEYDGYRVCSSNRGSKLISIYSPNGFALSGIY